MIYISANFPVCYVKSGKLGIYSLASIQPQVLQSNKIFFFSHNHVYLAQNSTQKQGVELR